MKATMQDRLDRAIEEFLSCYFTFHPTSATAVGLHQYDHLLEDRSDEVLADERRRLEDFRQWLRRDIDVRQLDRDAQADYCVVVSEIEAEILSLDSVRWWARDPSWYSDLACWSVHSLLAREYAPSEIRAKAACQRMEAIPRLFDQARRTLLDHARASSSTGPAGIPPIYIEIGRQELTGAKFFFDSLVPAFAETVSDDDLADQLRRASARAADACEDMLQFLDVELRREARGTFALGGDLFHRLLRSQEHITTPVEKILEWGNDQLRTTQEKMQEIASRIAPGVPLPILLEELAEDHPTASDLIASYRHRCEEIRRFIEHREIVTIPQGDNLRVVETPPFARSLIFAALDAPGPFDPDGLPTFFYVTPADPTQAPEHQMEYLRAHNRFAQAATIIHEAYPGHYVQSLHRRRTPSRVRKIFGAGSFIEGWAHYCEEMVLDQGYGEDDPRLRLFQLHEALWRIGRLIVGTRMHTDNLSPDEGIEFLVRECYQQRDNARREVWRYTRDPFVLIYSWGKWQIQSLRDAARTQWGSRFSLREFHDHLLAHGEPSVTLLRFLLLGDTIPPCMTDV